MQNLHENVPTVKQGGLKDQTTDPYNGKVPPFGF